MEGKRAAPKVAALGNRINFATPSWHSVTLNSNSIPAIPLNEFSLKDELSPLTPPCRPTYQSARPQISVQWEDKAFIQPLNTHKSSQPAPIIQIQASREVAKEQSTLSQ